MSVLQLPVGYRRYGLRRMFGIKVVENPAADSALESLAEPLVVLNRNELVVRAAELRTTPLHLAHWLIAFSAARVVEARAVPRFVDAEIAAGRATERQHRSGAWGETSGIPAIATALEMVGYMLDRHGDSPLRDPVFECTIRRRVMNTLGIAYELPVGSGWPELRGSWAAQASGNIQRYIRSWLHEYVDYDPAFS